MIACASHIAAAYKRFTSYETANCTLRTVTGADLTAIIDFLSRLTTDTLYMRYLTPKLYGDDAAIRREAQRLVINDGYTAVLVAQQGHEPQAIIGVAELVRDAQRSASAELALVIADAYQGRGIGRAMTTWLIADAARHGITSVQVEALAENTRMRRLVLGLKLPHRCSIAQGDISFTLDITSAQHWSVGAN